MARSSLPERFEISLAETCAVPPGSTLVVGLSGGLDSMVLLHLADASGADVRALHVNYRLRGNESDDDALLASRVCDRLGIPCRVAVLDPEWLGTGDGESVQEQARDIRYALFEEEARHTGARFVAVAHHLDDQVETVLMRMIRGSGLRGLAGMPPSRTIAPGSDILLIRPLLSFTRRDLEEFAAAEGIEYRNDRSNVDTRFERAKMRHAVVPAILEAFGEAGLRNVARTAHQAQSVLSAVVTDRLEADLEAILMPGGGRELSIDALLEFDEGWRDLLLLEACRRWAPDAPHRATTVDRLSDLLSSQTGRRAVFGSTEVWRARDRLVFKDVDERDMAEHPVVPGRPVRLPGGVFSLDAPTDADSSFEAAAKSDRNPLAEFADESMLAQEVTVGHWREGDRFQPLGMEGTTTVSDFLTGRKVPAHEKAGTLVVRSGARIVWVVGHRLAHPYRVTEATRRVVRMAFDPS